jgi:hypothetical protein
MDYEEYIKEHKKKYGIFLGKKGNYGVRNQYWQGYKGKGFLGNIKSVKGEDMTEYTIGVDLDGSGNITDIPTLVPTLTKEEIKRIQNYKVDDEIAKKAKKHALERIKAGKSVYLEEQ